MKVFIVTFRREHMTGEHTKTVHADNEQAVVVWMYTKYNNRIVILEINEV